MRHRLLTVLACGISAASLGQTTRPATEEIDACGTLVRAAECVLFEGGGGKWVLADYGRYDVGDRVRVVGTIDRNCVTICQEGDGCIRGAVLYDPAVFPCGTQIEVPFDPCGATAGGLLGAATVGLLLARRTR